MLAVEHEELSHHLHRSFFASLPRMLMPATSHHIAAGYCFRSPFLVIQSTDLEVFPRSAMVGCSHDLLFAVAFGPNENTCVESPTSEAEKQAALLIQWILLVPIIPTSHVVVFLHDSLRARAAKSSPACVAQQNSFAAQARIAVVGQLALHLRPAALRPI